MKLLLEEESSCRSKLNVYGSGQGSPAESGGGGERHLGLKRGSSPGSLADLKEEVEWREPRVADVGRG